VDWLWEFDQQLFRSIHIGWHATWLDYLFWVISSSGLGQVQVTLILMTVRWGATLDRAKTLGYGPLRVFKGLRASDWYPWAAPLLVTWAVTGIVNSSLKRLLPRDRPSNFIWAHPQEQFYGNSFPSGHSATSFGLAFAVLLLTRGRGPWGWLALLWACAVGVSRMYRGVHWPTDVLGGACVGLICACAVISYLERRIARGEKLQEKDRLVLE
jgi:membrane-associated phospholipid phosphatase